MHQGERVETLEEAAAAAARPQVASRAAVIAPIRSKRHHEPSRQNLRFSPSEEPTHRDSFVSFELAVCQGPGNELVAQNVGTHGHVLRCACIVATFRGVVLAHHVRMRLGRLRD